MKRKDGLERLIALARRVRSPEQHEAPFGFATRVASRALATDEDDPLVLWERMARWSLAVALVACIATAVLHPRAQRSPATADFAGLRDSAENLW